MTIIPTGQPDWSGVVAPGLGALAYGPVSRTVSGGNIELASVPLPPTARTLILSINTIPLLAECFFVTIIGNVSGYTYYNQAPYLAYNTSHPFICCPVSAVVDTSVLIQMDFLSNGIPVEISVYYDTLQFDESVFYNGPITLSSLNGNGTMVTGPCRLLTADLATFNGAIAYISMEGNQLVYSYSIAGTSPTGKTIDLGEGLILGAGLTCGVTWNSAGNVEAQIVTAYP